MEWLHNSYVLVELFILNINCCQILPHVLKCLYGTIIWNWILSLKAAMWPDWILELQSVFKKILFHTYSHHGVDRYNWQMCIKHNNLYIYTLDYNAGLVTWMNFNNQVCEPPTLRGKGRTTGTSGEPARGSRGSHDPTRHEDPLPQWRRACGPPGPQALPHVPTHTDIHTPGTWGIE